ncbi:hypothetical protein SAV14893_097600 [Streptomyces avermitilis]|uniref:Uncharacterized protein n=1 Tax=Streptomyces avermitilis TaxID=33903 RepID=A0A4D4MGF2_STRAX|nr:hypothetical protein [Streptomyces avermitilis]GDY70367.1 hypothetical protein SAV14893_097600 [Streptomyces avermitilis]
MSTSRPSLTQREAASVGPPDGWHEAVRKNFLPPVGASARTPHTGR